MLKLNQKEIIELAGGSCNLNTSHVKVKPKILFFENNQELHLNTSHVKVKQEDYVLDETDFALFKYISC